MSGRSPPLYCTLILFTMYSHQSYPNITTVVIHSHEYSTTVILDTCSTIEIMILFIISITYQNAPGHSGHTNVKVGSEVAITELLYSIGSTVYIIVTLIVM